MTWTKADVDNMDRRLKQWGTWCRAGTWDPSMWESDARRGVSLTRDQVADAEAVWLMVRRLPIDMRIVCQVHYVIRPVEPETGQGETRVAETNRRLRDAGVHRRLNGEQYRYLRDRAITNMLNGQKGLTPAARGVSSAPNGSGIRAPKESEGLAA